MLYIFRSNIFLLAFFIVIFLPLAVHTTSLAHTHRRNPPTMNPILEDENILWIEHAKLAPKGYTTPGLYWHYPDDPTWNGPYLSKCECFDAYAGANDLT